MRRSLRRSLGRLGHLAARCAATVALLALLIGVPCLLVAFVGSPLPSPEQLRTAWDAGRVDDDTIVRLGTTLFLLLWAWFAVTAVAEAARVLRARPTQHRRRVVFAPPARSPSGWIQRLVRLALISSTALASTTLNHSSALARGGGVAFVRPPVAAVAAPAGHMAAAPGFVSTGRDTPYSIAARLGDASLRTSLIELNRGRPTPAGAAWSGGVFPAGMDVALPQGATFGPTLSWSTYTVERGDSVYGIAAELAANDDRRVVDVADKIIERNLGRTMVDGRVFTDPSLIFPGWQLEVPVLTPPPATESSAVAVGHVVTKGESYWAIAEAHLRATGGPSGPGEVADLVRTLRDLNAVRLGHDHPDMLHPGDVVVFPGSPAPGPPPVVETPVVEPSLVIADPLEVEPATEPVVVTAPTPTADTRPSTTVPPASTTPTNSPAASSTATVPASTIGDTNTDPDTDVVDDEGDAEQTSALPVGLAAAVLLGAGALGVLEARRRHQLRRAVVGARLEPPTAGAVETETLLRSLDAPERALRLDLALRSASHQLVARDRFVIGALLTTAGEVTLLLDGPADDPAGPWTAGSEQTRWVLPPNVTPMELAPSARRAAQPCPALIHLGPATEDGVPAGDLFVDLEAIGVLCIDGPPESVPSLLNAIGASLAASPLGEALRVVTTGIDDATHLGNLNAESADSLDAALDVAAVAIGATRSTLAGGRTFAARASAGREDWEPVVLVVGRGEIDLRTERALIDATGTGGGGLGVVVDRPISGARWFLRHDVQRTRAGWTLEPLGFVVTPVAVEAEELHALHDLLDAADRPARVELHAVDESASSGPIEFVERAWSLMVSVLGQVDVIDHDGNSVPFERGKALELAVWLSQHRERPTRAGARTALWELDVRDATFANVVSDARRAMARAVVPPEGEEWIERTLTEQLPLHHLVVSDADLLRARVDAARGMEPEDAIRTLRPGLDLITDLPFAGTGYLWPDAEGITSALTLLCTSAATELAKAYLAIGDVDGVFWSTGQGLKVLYGHEELIALRMRAHARCGDLAGVRNEWEVYERALTADPWSNGEPSPKLVEIRRELLSAG